MKSSAGPHIKEGISKDTVCVAARKVLWHDQYRTPRICTVISCVPLKVRYLSKSPLACVLGF